LSLALSKRVTMDFDYSGELWYAYTATTFNLGLHIKF
jgi:hypothetical protein